jgi:hypothetical protein
MELNRQLQVLTLFHRLDHLDFLLQQRVHYLAKRHALPGGALG